MSFWDDVSKFIGTDRSDSFIGHIGEVLAHDNVASLAATAVAAYFGLPYVPGGPELIAYASEMAGAAPTAVGPGGITAGTAITQAGTTAAELQAVASGTGAGLTTAGTVGTGAGLTTAAGTTAAGMGGTGLTAALGTGAEAGGALTAAGTTAAGMGGGTGLTTALGANTLAAAGTVAAGATPWYLTPAALQAGAGIAGGLLQSASQRQAAAAQSDAAQRGLDLQ